MAGLPEGYRLPETDTELLAECDVDTFGSGGPGGQNVNRRATAVRLTHRPSGVVLVCQDERTQLSNKRRALERLRARLAEMLRPRKKRRATKVPISVRVRIRVAKKHRGETKRLRRKPAGDD